MLQLVDTGERGLEDYRGIAADELLEQLRGVAAGLQGARVLHVNATGYGGGVSELLRSTVPLYNDLGLVCDWRTIRGEQAFFEATKAMHNALQGGERGLSDAQREAYLATSAENAAQLQERYDFVFVHDPQPAALLALHGKGDARWIWRCHIDTSQPHPETWELLRGYLTGFDAAVFTMEAFAPPSSPTARVDLIPPAIDPLSPKNLELASSTARELLGWIGIRPRRPLITQVSRFDPWKDPLGVIDAYRLARDELPGGLELALVGSMALDDPEGWDVYAQVQAASRDDPLIHVFTNLTGVGNVEVNAFQRLSSVVVQKSLREGFGLVVSEALWKRTPVVAGRTGGIELQMADGAGGALVQSVEECARAIIRMIVEPDLAGELAERGRERVREHFLLPRLLLNELALIADLAEDRPPREADRSSSDPVCGMAIADAVGAPSVSHAGRRYLFCSEDCRIRFIDEPQRYLRPPAGFTSAGFSVGR